MLIGDIRIGERHRRDLGDLAPLADSIKTQGLLQPIGITADNELVFGERRLAVCRDILKWTEIATRTVDVTTIVDGEHDENELRKNFTRSERLAIFQAISRKSRGNPGFSNVQNSGELARAAAIKAAGFIGRSEIEVTNYITNHAHPEIMSAVDKGEISLSAGNRIAHLAKDKQLSALHEKLEGRKHARAAQRIASIKTRTVTIPWRAKPAARILLERWPADLARDLAIEIQRRLAQRQAAE